ncbi:MAG TPA: acetyl-CoA carboxylase biotin carboxyl carrier protein subunit [Acidobacteriaceae bacterium]
MTFDIQIAGRTRRIILPPELLSRLQPGAAAAPGGPLPCTVDGELQQIDAQLLEPGVLSLLIEGRAHRCILDEGPTGRAVLLDGKRLAYSVDDPRSLRARRSAGVDENGPVPIKSPMPGRVARVLAAAGDTVAAQQGILVIEAMKMQNEMKAPKAGTVVRISVAEGDTVTAGQVLAVVE